MAHQVVTGIWVFKTSIRTDGDVEKIASILDRELGIKKWNIDREDVDHVLRIESGERNPEYYIQLIKDAGYFCEELPD